MENRGGTFHLKSPFQPTGDQPEAIEALCAGLKSGMRYQTLLGVTGSGKTFTMANVIARMNRPTLILEPNKTLAAQLCSEMREFFPDAAVEFFVSYYDYYQPEAYIPGKDMYIEKDAAINDEIDRLRHSATSSLLERRDVIIVASVSCIYSLGDPAEYESLVLSLRPGMAISRDELLARLVSIQYERSDLNFVRDKFRVRGDTVDIYPAGFGDTAIRVEFFGEEIDRENKIINDLLSLVKLDKKAADLHIEDKNINELLDQIIKRLKPIADKKKVELVMENFKPVVAQVDETKLSLALSNLVENAIKYNKDEGWVHVSLNVDHKYFYVKVEDSGIGIPEESQEHIFERFYRVDKSHSREIGGTGLGLAITRSAVLMHRGAIKVYSKLGEGTTFTVRIPLIHAE